MVAGAGAYLERAVDELRDDELARPTPCARWTVADLLVHVGDSLDVLRATHDTSRAEVPPLGTDATSLEHGIRVRVTATVQAAYAASPRTTVDIGDRQLPEELLQAVTALEMGIHGWDIVSARGIARAMPASLASGLLQVALTTVPADDRGGQFGPPSRAPEGAPPVQRLLAWLGRADPSPGPAPEPARRKAPATEVYPSEALRTCPPAAQHPEE
nr:TIGR03086 family metal-binding protein [Nocardioides thalensis]